jgi:hypothetical protein
VRGHGRTSASFVSRIDAEAVNGWITEANVRSMIDGKLGPSLTPWPTAN